MEIPQYNTLGCRDNRIHRPICNTVTERSVVDQTILLYGKVREETNLAKPIMHFSISHNAPFLLQNRALWDICLMRCGIRELCLLKLTVKLFFVQTSFFTMIHLVTYGISQEIFAWHCFGLFFLFRVLNELLWYIYPSFPDSFIGTGPIV